MGKVTELLPGNDGRVRMVRVIRSDRTEGVYPIKLLYPLELSVTPVAVSDVQEETDGVSSTLERPKRASALRCLKRMRECN